MKKVLLAAAMAMAIGGAWAEDFSWEEGGKKETGSCNMTARASKCGDTKHEAMTVAALSSCSKDVTNCAKAACVESRMNGNAALKAACAKHGHGTSAPAAGGAPKAGSSSGLKAE